MSQLFVFVLVAFSLQSAFASSQTITCENKAQRLTIRAKLTNIGEDVTSSDVDVAVLVKKSQGFQGVLRNEKISQAVGSQQLTISGEAAAKNLTFELVVPENKLKRNFKNVTLAAFLDNPLSDGGFYPNRVSVRCSSQVN